MRLFVAICLSKEIKDYLYKLQKNIGSGYAKIKWVEKKNLHLTLKFLGEVSDDKLEDLKNKLVNIKFSKFEAKLGKFGVYPNESRINVVWAGLEPENKIIELQKKIDSETLNFGDMKLGAHITLGRVKSIKNKEKFKDKIFNIKLENLRFSVGEFVLFKSVLSKDGPSYGVLKEYKLDS